MNATLALLEMKALLDRSVSGCGGTMGLGDTFLVREKQKSASISRIFLEDDGRMLLGLV